MSDIIERLRQPNCLQRACLVLTVEAADEIARWRGLWDDQMREKNVLKIENERLTAGNAAVDAQFRIWRERAEKAEADNGRLLDVCKDKTSLLQNAYAQIERWKSLALQTENAMAQQGNELRADNERLTVALQKIAREQSAKDATEAADRFQQIARRALEPKP